MRKLQCRSGAGARLRGRTYRRARSWVRSYPRGTALIVSSALFEARWGHPSVLQDVRAKTMARPRELLSLLQIAEETGISYQTLRGYAIRHGDEIPSEGWGRATRYPRVAIKVFERLRRESRPGRKPRQETVRQEAPAAAPE